MIDLDQNATTPLLPEALAAMEACWRDGLRNPSSQHAAGRRARAAWEEAIQRIVTRLGGRAGRGPSGERGDRLIVTSGGTEANHLAIRGLMGEEQAIVAVSAIEHPCVREPAERSRRRGHRCRLLAVDRAGRVDLEDLDACLADSPRLVSVMLANHETGVIQPIREIAARCREAGAWLHCDASQAVGKIEVDFRSLDVDALTISSHKFHGPVGVGGLLIRHDLPLQPLLEGGIQQDGLRAGTEPVALLAGMAAAFDHCARHQAERTTAMRARRDQLEGLLADAEPMVIAGRDAERLPQTVCACFPGADRQALVMALDLAGVACSTGSACSSGSAEPSPVLAAMGLSEGEIGSAVRFSWGAATSEPEMADGADRILKAVKHLRQGNPSRNRPDATPQPAAKPL